MTGVVNRVSAWLTIRPPTIVLVECGPRLVADPEHLKLLRQGVDVWNEWRAEKPSIRPDLGEANLSEAYLNGANLYEAYLYEANLSGAAIRMLMTLRAVHLPPRAVGTLRSFKALACALAETMPSACSSASSGCRSRAHAAALAFTAPCRPHSRSGADQA
jgi:hypothetical protein